MRGCRAAGGVLLAAALTLTSLHASSGEEQAKTAALQFGQALTRGDPSSLRPTLPSRGKVRLNLIRLGPEQGSYSGDQVEALLRDFLREGAVRSYDLVRVQCASDQFALVHARVRLADRDGRSAEIDLHLTFQPEDDRWVLREFRESPP